MLSFLKTRQRRKKSRAFLQVMKQDGANIAIANHRAVPNVPLFGVFQSKSSALPGGGREEYFPDP